MKYFLFLLFFGYAFAHDDGSYITKFKSDWVIDSVMYYGDEVDSTCNVWQRMYHRDKGCNKFSWIYGDEYEIEVCDTLSPLKCFYIDEICKNRICKLCHRKERLKKVSEFYHELNAYGKLDSVLNKEKK